MKIWGKILFLLLIVTTSCEMFVTDIPVTTINKTDTTMTVVFFATDYLAPTISNIITNNEIPVVMVVDVPPYDSITFTVYEPERLDIWYAIYRGEKMYGGNGKLINPVIKIE